jgi:uncharacterized protein (TIGR03435 family)
MDGRYFSNSTSVRSLAGRLRMHVDRPVIDETGLTGNFKVELNWTPSRMPPSLAGLAQLPLDGGSIFTAVQEQLGLKLDPSIRAMPVVVIDAIEYPTND